MFDAIWLYSSIMYMNVHVHYRSKVWGHSEMSLFVRRRTSEKMLEECLMPSVKHGGGNVMVWGCFGAGKVRDLYKVKGILNKEGCHSILQCHAIPCGQRLIYS